METRSSAARALLFLAWFGGVGAIGCREDRRPASISPPTPDAAQSAERDDALRRARFDLAVLTRDLERARPRPSRRSPSRCADDQLRAEGADPTVFLVARDVRLDQRQLLPLVVTSAIARDELTSLREALGVGVDAGAAGVPPSERVAAATATLAALRARPYVAEVQITAYAEPRVIRKVGALHSEWVPGVLAADLVVYDRRDDALHCRAPLLVRNRVEDAPISLRRRSDTRERLVRELGAALHEAGAAALTTLSAHLRWPAPTLPLAQAAAAGTANEP